MPRTRIVSCLERSSKHQTKLRMSVRGTNNAKEYWIVNVMVNRAICALRTLLYHPIMESTPAYKKSMPSVSVIFVFPYIGIEKLHVSCISLVPVLFFCIIDPCDRLICNVTNTVCQVVFDTGTPFCACAPGYMGDPAVKCGNYIHF